MRPAEMNISTRHNARYVEEFSFTDDDGIAFDFTGYSAELQVRQFGGSPGSPLMRLGPVKTNTQGVWIIEPVQGVVRIRIDRSTLKALWDDLAGPDRAGEAVELTHDLVMTAPDGGVDAWFNGAFIINPGVTL